MQISQSCLDARWTCFTEAGLADQLANALQVPTVDLVDLRRAPLGLRGRVLQDGRLLYSADGWRRRGWMVEQASP